MSATIRIFLLYLRMVRYRWRIPKDIHDRTEFFSDQVYISLNNPSNTNCEHSLCALLTFQEPHLHHSEGCISLSRHLRTISQTLFRRGKTLRIITVLLATSLLLSVIYEFGPLWQLALAAPVGLYGLTNAAVLSAGGIGSLLSARLTLTKPVCFVGVAGLLVGSSLALVVVKNAVVVILAQGALVAGGVGISMVFTRLLHDCLPSPVRAGAASGVSALSSMIFVPFALLFGVVSQHIGIFHAGWMVVGVTLLASALLVTASTTSPCHRASVAAPDRVASV